MKNQEGIGVSELSPMIRSWLINANFFSYSLTQSINLLPAYP
jgi:hypothetical protein